MKAREGERKEGRGGGSRMRVALERKNNGFGARLVIGELRSVLSSSKRSEVKRELIGKNDGGITIKERSNEASA